MRILIIGKNGQLGSELVSESKKSNHSVFAYDKSELDIKNIDNIKNVLDRDKPDFVINTSAFHLVPACEDYPDEAYLINATAVGLVAGECMSRNIRFVTYSTDYVFDGQKGSPYVEDDLPNPLQVYGMSKLAGEKSAMDADKESIVIRTCGVYGGKSGSVSKGGNFVLSILKEAKVKNELEVSSEQIVNPTFARNLASASLALINLNPSGGIYHLANEGYCSWAKFAAEIVKVCDSDLKIIPVDRSGAQSLGAKVLMRPIFSALKNEKAAALGIKLPDWQVGVKEYVQFLNN